MSFPLRDDAHHGKRHRTTLCRQEERKGIRGEKTMENMTSYGYATYIAFLYFASLSLIAESSALFWSLEFHGERDLKRALPEAATCAILIVSILFFGTAWHAIQDGLPRGEILAQEQQLLASCNTPSSSGCSCGKKGLCAPSSLSAQDSSCCLSSTTSCHGAHSPSACSSPCASRSSRTRRALLP